MKKIMFNDKYGLTAAVLQGHKTMTRRIVPDGTPMGNWNETEKKLRYKVGEIIAVAQSYRELNRQGYVAPEWYDHTCESSAGYNNKMFVEAELMPHRIKITDIRIERLQDISDEDCLKEGVLNCQQQGVLVIENHAYFIPAVYCHKIFCFETPRAAFAYLFDHISGQGTWDRNPYVVAYSFVIN